MLSYHIFVVRSMIYCISSDIFNIFCIILGNYGLLNDFLIKSSDWMSRNVNILDQVLHAISAHDHSIGVLAILKLKLQRVKSTELLMDKEFLKQLLGFSSICDGLQIRNVSESCK